MKYKCKIQEKIKDVMLGDEESLEEVKQNAFEHFLEFAGLQ